jgi:hypothetical protein
VVPFCSLCAVGGIRVQPVHVTEFHLHDLDFAWLDMLLEKMILDADVSGVRSQLWRRGGLDPGPHC